MEKKVDVLNRDSFIIKLKTLIEIMSDNKQGCCFALNGAWGSGKSFVLEKLEEKLKKQLDNETEESKYYVFHYDCWKYDYYEEPAVAIIAAMIDATDEELKLFSEGVETAMEVSLKTARKLLGAVASELCKNKIGIDLVEIASEAVEEQQEADIDDFDSLYGFKRALENTRKNIQKIAQDKTVLIVVDELDRCLPEYAIKVLERLHHIFVDLENIIVLVSMDKNQLEHSIQGIYGNIDVDIYLRKFISFKVDLDNGNASNYSEKYYSYFKMFNILKGQETEVEKILSDILTKLSMRDQERIFRKAELIHQIIKEDDISDFSIMLFEILFLTVAFRTKSTDLEWLSKIRWSADSDKRKQLGMEYYNKLAEYEKENSCEVQSFHGKYYIQKGLSGKTFFLLSALYNEYNNGYCSKYQCTEITKEMVEVIHRFALLVDIIDSD